MQWQAMQMHTLYRCMQRAPATTHRVQTTCTDSTDYRVLRPPYTGLCPQTRVLLPYRVQTPKRLFPSSGGSNQSPPLVRRASHSRWLSGLETDCDLGARPGSSGFFSFGRIDRFEAAKIHVVRSTLTASALSSVLCPLYALYNLG